MNVRRKGNKQRDPAKGPQRAGTGSGIQTSTITVAPSSTLAPPVAASQKVDEHEDEDRDREKNIDLYKAALESFDKTMVSVAGGSLAVSITFIHELVPTIPAAGSKVPLWIGWGGLLFSLGVIIVSMLTGHNAIECQLARKPASKWTNITTVLNICSVVALLVGFLGLAGFAAMNMFAQKPKAAATPVFECAMPKAEAKPPAPIVPVAPKPAASTH